MIHFTARGGGLSISGMRAAMGAVVLCLPLMMGLAADPAPPGKTCADLAALAIPQVAIVSARDVPAGAFTPTGATRALTVPAFCRVEVMASPSTDSSIAIEVWIPPADVWNGKLLGTGNGGFSGAIPYGPMAAAIVRGYATVGTDTGHAGDQLEFGRGHPEKIVDWAYRSVHVMTDVAKQVVGALHGRLPDRAYFQGCSTGGQQALSEAQRFPRDYDGIIAGDPGNNRVRLIIGYLWSWLALHDDNGKPILPASKLPMLTRAAVAACGGNDSVIADPRACKFDPSTLRCPTAASATAGAANNDSDSCLSDAQIAAVRKVYDGAKNPRTGAQIFAGWPRGSEQGWTTYLVNPPEPMRVGFFRYFTFRDRNWNPRTFNWDRDVDVVDAWMPDFSAIGRDLRAFKANHGKLIMYTGLADPVVPPQDTIDYYDAVVRETGGPAATQEFMRFFTLPGVGHCTGGTNRLDALEALEQWREHDIAPDNLVTPRAATSAATSAAARVATSVADANIQLEILSREPTANGQEILRGRVHGDVDPDDPANAIIQDLQLAPRNARGKVEYVATFVLAKPVDLTRASGLLMYQVVNRGNGNVSATAEGDISLISGWQGDVVPNGSNQTIAVPIARQRDGSPITGPVIARFYNIASGTNTVPIRLSSMGNGNAPPAYPPASLDQSSASTATLTTFTAENARGERTGSTIIPRQQWAFADCRTTSFPGTPDPTRLCLRDGFDPTKLYELVYTAKDPLVLGLGLAATRDIVSFFRYAATDRAGTPNPIAGVIKHAIAIGDSQSGNLIKTFIHLGFNQALSDSHSSSHSNSHSDSHLMVWDGVFPRIAARQTPINFRFALPGGAATLFEPGSEPVLWWGRYRDTARGRPAASLLDRCSATKTCPKIIEAFGSSELWGLRMSPGLIGTDAKMDIALPENVRRYYYPGTTHGGGRGGFRVDAASPGLGGGCLLPANPNPEADTTRALTKALIAWVVDGTPPPPSRYPRLANGELVPPTNASLKFPSATFTDSIINPVIDYDFGPQFNANDLSGVIAMQPPRIKQLLPTFVPPVNSDGNETASGVPSVLHQAPLGTYLGWNITASGFFAGQGCGFSGGYVPFAKTQADRAAHHDPRPSLEERYGTLEGYECVVERAARESVRDRFLLKEDADRLIDEARTSGVLPSNADSSAANRALARRLCDSVTPSP